MFTAGVHLGLRSEEDKPNFKLIFAVFILLNASAMDITKSNQI